MDEEKKYKIKAFLWDQIVRPIYSFFNLSQLSSLILAILILNFITIKSLIVFIVLIVLLIIFSIIDIIGYYKSGKFMDNYRKYKYPEYKAVIKKIRQERKNKAVAIIGNPPMVITKSEGEQDSFKKNVEGMKGEEYEESQVYDNEN